MSGITIYLDPSASVQSVDVIEVTDVKHWRTLVSEITESMGLSFSERAGVVFVGTPSSITRWQWLPNAKIFRSFLQARRLTIRLSETQSQSESESQSQLRIGPRIGPKAKNLAKSATKCKTAARASRKPGATQAKSTSEKKTQ